MFIAVRRLWAMWVLAVLAGLSGWACGQAPVAGWGNPAVAPREHMAVGWWGARHTALVEAVKAQSDAELLMIGDSITNNYDKSKPPDENFQPTWKTFYEPRKALNLGFSADTTADVLWRLSHGEIDGLHPKAAVVLIGTNNTARGQTAAQVGAGIDAVVALLEQRLPETKILLMGILPSDVSEAKSAVDREVNRYLARCYGENPRVTYIDAGSIFYKAGVLNTAVFYDPRLPQHGKALHPDTDGQRMMAEAIEPTLAKLMGEPPKMALREMTEINSAVIPVAKLEQDSYDWYGRHHAVLETAKADAAKGVRPRVVLVGDSITHFWGGEPMGIRVSGGEAWQGLFGSTPVINMGFGYDRTQNVLWRLRAGEFDGLSPEWVVLNIGTNNLPGSRNARSNSPEETAAGVEAVYEELHRLSPASKVVVMAIFPRGRLATDGYRVPIAATNKLLAAHFAGVAGVTYLDIGTKFLDADGSLPATLMPDGTHPNEAGYAIWAEALKMAGVRF